MSKESTKKPILEKRISVFLKQEDIESPRTNNCIIIINVRQKDFHASPSGSVFFPLLFFVTSIGSRVKRPILSVESPLILLGLPK